MSELDRVLTEIQGTPAPKSLNDLARRLDVSRDELDVMIGYWIHRGELVVEEVSCGTSGSCAGCPLTGPAGCRRGPTGPVMISRVGAPGLSPPG